MSQHLFPRTAAVLVVVFAFLAAPGGGDGPASADVPVPGGVGDGLALWLDASDSDADGDPSDDPADGAAITIWQDRSGNDRDAVVLSGKDPAAFHSTDPARTINGRPALTFTRTGIEDGSIYVVPDMDLRASVRPDVTVLAVYRPRALATSGNGNAVWGIDNLDWDRFFLSFFTGTFDGTDGVDDGLVGLGPSDQGERIPDSGAIGVTRLLTVVYDGDISGGPNVGPTNGSAVYFTGALLRTFTDTTSATDAQTQLAVGWDGDDNPFDGEIAEFIVYDRVLTLAEIRAVNGYLATKYGITLEGSTEVVLTLDDPGRVGTSGPSADVDLTAQVAPPTEGCPATFTVTPEGGGTAITATGTTDASGAVTAAALAVPAGDHDVEVTVGYPCDADPAEGTLEVRTEVDLALDDPAKVRTQRRDVDVALTARVAPATEGCPATFTLTPVRGGATITATGTTDGSGVVRVVALDVPLGTHEVEVVLGDPCEADPDVGILRIRRPPTGSDGDPVAPVPLAVPSGDAPSSTVPSAAARAALAVLLGCVTVAGFRVPWVAARAVPDRRSGSRREPRP